MRPATDDRAPEPRDSSRGVSPALAPRRKLVRALLAVGAPILTALIGTQCFTDIFQPVPTAQVISLTLTPDSVVASIGDRVSPFSSSLFADGTPAPGVPYHLHFVVQAPDNGVVEVIHADSALRDSLNVLKRGYAVVGVVPVSSMIANQPVAVTRRVRAVVPVLAPDSVRTTASPRAWTLTSFGDTKALVACGFAQSALLGCGASLGVAWRVSGSGTAAALSDAAAGTIVARGNGATTFEAWVDFVTAQWNVTVSQVARRVRSVSGSPQTDSTRATLAQPFVVQIRDANDSTMRVAGVQVGWKVASGGGTFVGGTDTTNSTTDASGLASATLRLGATVGAQSATASVANLLGTRATYSLTAYAPQPPGTPTSAGQFKANCTTAIATGSATDELSACFKATVTDPDFGATIRLAVEVRPLGTAFTGTATATSTAVASGGVASVTVTGLTDDTGYHWQFWAIDQTNRISALSSFGGNAETAADFATAVPQPPTVSGAAQLLKDCATSIATGGTVDTLQVCFKATVSDPDPGATVRLAVEVRPVGTAFTGTATVTSSAVASGGTASIVATGLTDDTGYHWQYWAIDETSRNSAVASFGANAETAADFTVSTPRIALSSASVVFTATLGGGNPASQTVTVSNGGGGSMTDLALGSTTYGSGSGWLTTATLSGATAPATLTLQPTTGTLAAGTYTATLPLTSAIARNSPQTVSVTFAVACAADPGEPNDDFASATQLTSGTAVSAKICSGTDADYYKIDLVEGQNLSVSLGTLPADYRLDVYGPSQALQLSSNNSGTTAESVSGTATVTGTFYVKVSGATSSAFSASATYTLTATVQRPSIQLASSSFAISLPYGWVHGMNSYVQLSNPAGVGYLKWQSSSNQPWLALLDNALNPLANGTGTCCGSGTDTLARFGIAVSGLAEGSYSGALSVSAAAASNSPRTLPVTLTVTHDLVMNGSFELDLVDWETSGDLIMYDIAGNGHTGSHYVALGRNSSNVDVNNASAQIYQKIRVPAATSVTLKFWTYITTNETSTTTAYDSLWFTLWDSTAASFVPLVRGVRLSNLDKSAGWVLNSYTVTQWAAGRTVWLTLDARSNATNPTIFRIDDVGIDWLAAAPPAIAGREGRPSAARGSFMEWIREGEPPRVTAAPPASAPGFLPETGGRSPTSHAVPLRSRTLTVPQVAPRRLP